MNCDSRDEIISGPTRIDMLNGINVLSFCDEDCCKEFLYENSRVQEVDNED